MEDEDSSSSYSRRTTLLHFPVTRPTDIPFSEVNDAVHGVSGNSSCIRLRQDPTADRMKPMGLAVAEFRPGVHRPTEVKTGGQGQPQVKTGNQAQAPVKPGDQGQPQVKTGNQAQAPVK